MHPETLRVVAARQVAEMHADARMALLARQAKRGVDAASRPRGGVGIGAPHARRKRLLARWIPGRPQSA